MRSTTSSFCMRCWRLPRSTSGAPSSSPDVRRRCPPSQPLSLFTVISRASMFCTMLDGKRLPGLLTGARLPSATARSTWPDCSIGAVGHVSTRCCMPMKGPSTKPCWLELGFWQRAGVLGISPSGSRRGDGNTLRPARERSSCVWAGVWCEHTRRSNPGRPGRGAPQRAPDVSRRLTVWAASGAAWQSGGRCP